jgi:mRNA interferase MazF
MVTVRSRPPVEPGPECCTGRLTLAYPFPERAAWAPWGARRLRSRRAYATCHADGDRAEMRRGEIWTIGNRTDLRYRVLVLSADMFNDRKNAAPFCAPIVRQRGSTELPPFAVALSEQDPITGVVVINRLRRLPADVGAERLGMVTGASMVRLTQAVRDLFEI